jgi:cytochrome c oxidase assembly factor CtaG
MTVALSPLTPLRALTAWRLEPAVLAVVVLLGVGYAIGVRRATAWPRARSWSFGCGLAVVAVAGCSFVGVYADTLFWVRALQNVLLLMVAPMLVAVSAPLTLSAGVLPARWRARLSRVLHSRPLVWATYPLVVTLLLVVPPLVLYLGPLYEQTLRSAAVSGAVGTFLALAGFTYFWTRFRVDPVPRRGSHLVTLAITIVEMVGDAVLGIVVWLGPLIAAGFYAAVARDWGPSLRTDQTIGAGVLWIGGDVVGLPFIGIVVSRMAREDRAEAATVDAALDAAEEAEPAAAGRLWWEDDPQLAERFHRR